jgi:hypothetical protein
MDGSQLIPTCMCCTVCCSLLSVLCCCPPDELLFEVPAHDAVLGPDGAVQHPGQSFLQVAAAVKAIMEGAAALAVPLRVKLAWGNSWGSLADLQL